MALRILAGGLLTTVQDLGRVGYQRYGVPVAGAMDPFALEAANLLVGNPPDAAALEVTLVGPRIEATDDCIIAVAGADLSLRVHGWELSAWSAVFVRRGWSIEFGGRKTGCRAILAVAGGITVPKVMNSRSTYLRGHFGGLEGRPVERGDTLPVGPLARDALRWAGRSIPVEYLPPYSDSPAVHVVLGPQDDYFTAEGIDTLLSAEYRTGIVSDRMGYRLQGPAIIHRGPAEIISDGVPLGAVQVPPDGQPIVMLADRQTTGGYPKVATVVRADIPLLAQCVPGQSSVRFVAVDVAEARARYRERAQALSALKRAFESET